MVKNMKKVLIITLCAAVVLASVLTGVLVNDSAQKNTYDETEKEKITAFFNNNFTLMNDMKNGLWPDTFDGVVVDKEGTILTFDSNGNSSSIQDALISEKAIQYFKAVSFPRPSIATRQYPNTEDKTVEFEFYYSTNRMVVGIAYTEANVDRDNFYERIQDNWYFVAMGMV